ncbi:uncharacterized protein LOC21386024 isoform X1 [Morus notabilis]|uniref:uncharacterized protein LOC21386024 isoform X1 n=1 Tax=Morus notabilis TaxID=981085 RepID=UPI000CED2A21|nr:uncharacterized protein LOC21386024 isoform X1 [Morus notabilis]
MADDDDDDFFGDFKFASTQPSVAPATTTTINSSSNTSGGDSFSDDDWGDFVTTRSNQIKTGFELFNGTNGQSPLGNSVDDESAATRGESEAPSWVKPRGALPLSLFGETEEEEESGAGEPTVGDGAPIFFRRNDGDDAKKGSGLNGGVGISDLLANLYSQSQQIKVQNGSYVNSNVNGANSNSNESGASVDGLRSSASSSKWHQNGFDSSFHDANQNSNNLGSNITVMTSNFNGFSSDLVEQSENFDNDDDEDDDGWEFKGACADKQEQGAVELPGPKVETISGKDQEIQVDGGERSNIEEPGPTIGFNNEANGPVDMSVRSDDTPHRTNDWNFVFDFNRSSVTQDNLWDSNSKSEKNDVETRSNFPSVRENGNVDENFWQFKDAFSEAGIVSNSEAAKVAAPSNLEGQALDGGDPHGPTNFFAASEGTFHKPQEWDVAFAFNSSPMAGNGVVTYTHSSSNHTGKGGRFSPDNRHGQSDDNFWEFSNAFSETGLKNEGEPAVSPDPSANIIPPAFDLANQGSEIKSESHQESLPLSIFGEEEVETDVSIHKPASYTRNSNKAPGSNLSINDLIVSLYSQAQQSTSLNGTPKVSENGTPSTTREFESDFVHDDDDFDDESWEFKDASFEFKAEDQSFATHFEDATSKYSTKLELHDYVDLYCKLKDGSRVVAINHFGNLKRTRSTDSVSGEELKLEALGEEIQKFHDQLCQEDMISEYESENLSELLKVLEEPKFKVLESEYHLSNQLSLAVKDLGSVVELLKHVTSTLRILKLGSVEEQSAYVSTWSKIVSVCAQELKHGALIWKQALQKNVQVRFLSEPQGIRYIIALGEIYRVVQVIGASAKLYKPWVLLYTVEPVSLFFLLNECTTLWSTSGLDEALQSISEQIDTKFDGTLKELLESMKYIHDLDALALQNHVFSGNQPLCRLSMLTAGIVPGNKMVVWDGGHYLLKLANLWANLITPNPPDLPHLHVS